MPGIPIRTRPTLCGRRYPEPAQARDFEPIRFVNNEQSCGIGYAGPYSHRAIPLLIESILGTGGLSTLKAIRVLFGIAQLFGAIEESDHPRVFVPPRAFDCGIVQETATLAGIPLQVAWGGNNRRSVEGSGPFTDLLQEWLGLALVNGRPVAVLNKVGWQARLTPIGWTFGCLMEHQPGMAVLQVTAAFISGREVSVPIQ